MHLFYRCPLLLDRSKHFIRQSLLLVRFTLSLYVDQGLQRQHRSFLFVRRWENEIKKCKCHYLSQHAVFKESATAPIRVVYDCSCRQSQSHPSLNDYLLTGPPIANNLTGILLRSRCHKYGFTTDIEKAFLQVSIDEEDRDATRFFWLSDPDDPTSAFFVYRLKVVLSVHQAPHSYQMLLSTKT